MKRLTSLEEKVLLGMDIVPNIWQDANLFPPSTKEIVKWCAENGLGDEIKTEEEALKLLISIRDKIADPEDGDALSLEDEATWILSKSFTKERLMEMTAEEIVDWLQDWKYYFGFRKMEGWGDIYKRNAIAALEGSIKLGDSDYVEYISEEDA